MITLVLETSSPRGVIALLDHRKVWMRQDIPFGVRNSSDLVSSLQKLFDEAGLNIKDLSKIIVGIGPGSFTGLRIGATVAKAFSYAHQIPIYEVPSLRCFDPDFEGFFGVVLDAKIHGICLQVGQKQADQVSYQPQILKGPPESLKKDLTDLPLILTSQKEPIVKKLAGLVSPEKIIECSPSPLQMLKEASINPELKAKNALDELELKYFDSPK